MDTARRLARERPSPLGDLLPPPFVVPRYDGWGVANVPATVGQLLGATIGSLPALDESLWQTLSEGHVERVVLLLADALGWERHLQALARHEDTARWLRESATVSAPITSIFPSTTSATLATLWTGSPPVEHGVMGYTMWLRQHGAVVNMIELRPANRMFTGTALPDDADERLLLPVSTVPEQLAAQGVETHTIMPAGILDSGLSRLHGRGVKSTTGYAGIGDCVTLLRDCLSETAGRRSLIVAYWPDLDSLGHLRGPTPHNWDAEWRVFTSTLREGLVAGLDSSQKSRTVLAITSDHGQHALAESRRIYLTDHPELAACLLMPPTSDPRAAYLHVRDGAREEAMQYLEANLAHAFHAIESRKALDAGLWGSGVASNEVRCRIGDIVVLGREGYVLLPSAGDFDLQGGHGSLLPDEALVPWLAWRLDR